MSTENLHEETDDIAIIGMAGRFPGASDLEKFWRNLQGGVESISHFTVEELLDSGFPLEVIRHPDFVSAKAVLDDADMFDAAFFGISPREAELMDPQHRLLMECAWQALEDAGYDSERSAGRISVFTSTGLNTYLPFNICSHPGLAHRIGGFHLSICNDKDFVATRIAYAMNLKGRASTSARRVRRRWSRCILPARVCSPTNATWPWSAPSPFTSRKRSGTSTKRARPIRPTDTVGRSTPHPVD